MTASNISLKSTATAANFRFPTILSMLWARAFRVRLTNFLLLWYNQGNLPVTDFSSSHVWKNGPCYSRLARLAEKDANERSGPDGATFAQA